METEETEIIPHNSSFPISPQSSSPYLTWVPGRNVSTGLGKHLGEITLKFSPSGGHGTGGKAVILSMWLRQLQITLTDAIIAQGYPDNTEIGQGPKAN